MMSKNADSSDSLVNLNQILFTFISMKLPWQLKCKNNTIIFRFESMTLYDITYYVIRI